MANQKIINSQKFSANNAEQMHLSNRILVLRTIKDSGLISRKSLAEQTGLTPASITLIVSELLSKNLIMESGYLEGTEGRRLVGLKMVEGRFATVVVRITFHYFAVGLFDINSVCIQVEKVPMPVFDDIAQTLQQMKEKIDQYVSLAAQNHLEILGIGAVLSDGFRFTPGECIMLSRNGAYVDLQSFLKNYYSYPVFFDTSGNFSAYFMSCLRSEQYFRQQTIVIISVSYSVDCGILVDRTILRGAASIPGSIGKIPVPDGEGAMVPLADVVSTDVLLAQAKQMLPDYPGSVLQNKPALRSHDLIEAFYQGDPIALHIYIRVARALGYVIHLYIQMLHPHQIFMFDEIPDNDTFIRMVIDTIRAISSFNSYFPTIRKIPNSYRATSEDPSMRGASQLITNHGLKEPSLFQ